MNKYDLDLFVIGAGSAGVRAARMAAGFGARVAIAEVDQPGGTCVNAGCIPKKLLYYSAIHAEIFNDANGYGWQNHKPGFNWQHLRDNKDREISRLNGIYRKLLVETGVEILSGRAELAGPQTVAVNGKLYSTERIIIATGSYAVRPDIPGAEFCITSDEAFHLDKLPKKIIIAGGGYIALEFAGIFNGLGVQTSLVHRGPLPLGGFDDDIRQAISEELRKKGIQLLLNTEIKRIGPDVGGYQVVYGDNSHETTDLVMFAIGRRPASDGIGLEQPGVKLAQDGAIITNSRYQTNVPSIYAIGDVAGRQQLTPVAIAEAIALTRQLYQDNQTGVDYENIPTCIFSQPNVAMVGLTETQARQQFSNIDIYRTRFRPLKHTLTGNSEKTLMKLVVDRTTDKVLGAHMIGADAGEIIQGIAIALRAGATKTQFDTTIGIHPTAAEEFVTMRQAVSKL